MTTAEFIRTARGGAGLSGRALARRAGVAYSTVVRIESGLVDPTTGMLETLLAAMGLRLILDDRPIEQPWLGSLADAWEHDVVLGQDRADWTRVRAFTDYLAHHPESVADAVTPPPPRSGSAFMDNLLAAIAEVECDRHDIPVPAWTGRIRPLDLRWMTPTTPRREVLELESTLPQFLARNIALSADSLWRQRV